MGQCCSSQCPHNKVFFQENPKLLKYHWERLGMYCKGSLLKQTVPESMKTSSAHGAMFPINLLETLTAGMPKHIFEVKNKKGGVLSLFSTLLVQFLGNGLEFLISLWTGCWGFNKLPTILFCLLLQFILLHFEVTWLQVQYQCEMQIYPISLRFCSSNLVLPFPLFTAKLSVMLPLCIFRFFLVNFWVWNTLPSL